VYLAVLRRKSALVRLLGQWLLIIIICCDLLHIIICCHVFRSREEKNEDVLGTPAVSIAPEVSSSTAAVVTV
jgi:hypothetical protein